MKKLLFTLTAIIAFGFIIKAQNVNIPDANFKAYLVGNTSINTNGDTEIQVSEASAYSGAIDCPSSSISDLTGIEAFTALTHLNCYNNQLSSIDVSNNTALDYLSCSVNQLTSLDVSQNTLLETIGCGSNQLTSLDLSNNINLTSVHFYQNSIVSIDLSHLSGLTQLNCLQNSLTHLNVANGNNTNVTNFNATNNPNLTCINVDNVSYSTSNWTSVDASSSFSTTCSPCTINIPDANFKSYLVGNAAINTNGNTEIECSEASAFTGTINCGTSSISDLTGIEAFTNLTILLSSNNPISTVDLSQNAALTEISFLNNNLSNIDLSSNTQLTNIELSSNSINSLDVTSNVNLTTLWAQSNNMSSLTLPNSTSLATLVLSQNNLTNLDLSSYSNLVQLDISANNLTQLNVANGNNSNVTYFLSSTNPSLICIQVDNVSYSTTNWTGIDPASSFSTNCITPCTVNIPDANFKAYLVGNAAINTNGNTEIECSEASAFTSMMFLNNLNVTDFTGLEAFVNMTDFRTQNNPINSLDISANTALTSLTCFNSNITSIDLSNNTLLETMELGNNSLTSLDVSNNTNLVRLVCGNNQISTLNLSQNTALEELYIGGNSGNLFTNIDISDNLNLKDLNIKNNQITSLNLSNNLALERLWTINNPITSLDLSAQTGLIYLHCTDNNLTSLDLSNGNNSNFYDYLGGTGFDATGNPNLSCIQVDDATYSTTNWIDIDATASFSENCGVVSPVLVNSITVQGQGGVSEITANGGTLQMEAEVLPLNADDATYTWSVVNSSAASISATGLLTALANGDVDVIATANDGSGTIGAKTITISNQGVGIKNIAFENLNVYPNPGTGIVNIAVGNEEITSIRVFDIAGRVVAQYGNESQINVSDMTSGIYMLEIANEDKRSIVKLIVR